MIDIQWPEALVRELADRRGLVFLGAGASRSCQASTGEKFPDWWELLNSLGSYLTGGDKDAFDGLMEKSRLLDAAQVIADSMDTSSFHNRLLTTFKHKRIKPNELYEAINVIDQPIVLTTNYDQIYEDYWDSLDSGAVADRQLLVATPADEHLIDHMRAGRRLLIKLHGCISNPHKVVLSRSSYAENRTKNMEFYRVVSALMLTRTMLFVGCGFGGDPDIDLLLEDAAFTARSEYPHYALVPKGQHPSLLKALKTSFNIQAIEYEARGTDHSDLLVHMADLAKQVENSASRV